MLNESLGIPSLSEVCFKLATGEEASMDEAIIAGFAGSF